MGNNPISRVDPDGRFDKWWEAFAYKIFNGGKIEYASDKNEWFVGQKVRYEGEGGGTQYERVFDAEFNFDL